MPTHGTAELPDGPTRWWCDGPTHAAAPRAVLVHGFALPAYHWEPLVARLTDAGVRTLRYDLYGRGDSARLPRAAHDWRLYVRQLRALLDALDWPRPTPLIGHSLGGHIAARFALSHPADCGRLSLIAPLVQPPSRWLVAPLWLPFLGRAYITRRYVPRLLDGQTTPERRARFARQVDDGFARAILSTIRHLPRWPGRQTFDDLASRDLPVQLVWSRDDEVVPYDDGVALARDHGWPMADFDGLGHAPHTTDADATAAVIQRFLYPAGTENT